MYDSTKRAIFNLSVYLNKNKTRGVPRVECRVSGGQPSRDELLCDIFVNVRLSIKLVRASLR